MLSYLIRKEYLQLQDAPGMIIQLTICLETKNIKGILSYRNITHQRTRETGVKETEESFRATI